ncbi:serine hydrolase domain-containing protein [Luteimonas salinilitoris]|uniref:Serine hydrolase domain-containing protein n=1 Tax=Luteimonas salinilitoris TaxID=3237697 RepID=A0ABV4HN32_9GAMM
MRVLAAIAACLLLPGAGAAHGDPMQANVDALMRDYSGGVPGAAVLVLHDGDAVVRRGYGLANLEAGVPVTPASNFRLASLTKQFTAAAILLLAEDGRLRLDDPLRKWLPTLPAAAEPVTLHHLLSHTSGLIDYEEVMPEAIDGQLRDADVLALLEPHDRLYFAPGTQYRYSNSAYALLALIVGEASGSDFAGFLRERIFLPLGMARTVAFEDGVSTVADRAYGYSRVDGEWTRSDQSPTSAVLGDGGIYSSIDDLAKWDAALYDDRLLSDASRALAFASQTTTPTGEDDVDAYGYGWRLHGDQLWHSGETIGFRNVILRFPRERLTVVVLSNRNHPEPYATARAIADLWPAGPARHAP